MVDGLAGEDTLLVAWAVEQDIKQEQENVQIHLHLEVENRAPEILQNQEKNVWIQKRF